LVSFKTSPISSKLSQILSKSSNPNFIRSSMNPSFATLTVSSSATTTLLLIPPLVQSTSVRFSAQMFFHSYGISNQLLNPSH
jgi:hypothetical protein